MYIQRVNNHLTFLLLLVVVINYTGSIDTDVDSHPFFELSVNPCLDDPGFCFSVPTQPRDLTLASIEKETAITVGGIPMDFIVLKLYWTPPAETYGELKGYQVSFRLIGPPELLMEENSMKSNDGVPQVTPTHAVRRNVTEPSYTSTQIDNIRE